MGLPVLDDPNLEAGNSMRKPNQAAIVGSITNLIGWVNGEG
jgi:hypothetical protein